MHGIAGNFLWKVLTLRREHWQYLGVYNSLEGATTDLFHNLRHAHILTCIGWIFSKSNTRNIYHKKVNRFNFGAYISREIAAISLHWKGGGVAIFSKKKIMRDRFLFLSYGITQNAPYK